MKFELIQQPNKKYSALQQILINRGIKQEEVEHYLNLSDEDINDYNLFGKHNLQSALAAIGEAISKNQSAIIIVDSDCDGMTSAALLINYLYKIFPTWVSNCLTWKMHSGKQHGLKDCIDEIVEKKYNLVLCPDSASNDYEEHKRIREYGGKTIVLDHHLADKVSEDAIIINNQLSEYPNKELSGVGVVWQFCRFIDNFFNLKLANNYLDLVALGLCADMMSLKSFETRHLITKGFKKDNIKNPFIEGMLEKNSFPLSKSDYLSAQNDMACTSIGAAFFIVPFVNAMTRTGTQAEKELLFKSMLDHQSFVKILSNKRGHKEGEKETILAQAVRTATNVKNRQTRAEEAGMALLESKIAKENLLDHKILLFKLKPNEMEPNIRGLVANKMMAKYQRPCLVLTHSSEKAMFEGSGRGYTKTGIASLKDILIQSQAIAYAQGHDNAMGCGISEELIPRFIEQTDKILEDVSTEPLYRIDYDLREYDDNKQLIIDIANMNDFWGQDIDRALINIRFKITNSNLTLMKNDTLKITLPYNISIIKFGVTQEELQQFTVEEGYLELNAICKCAVNNWNGNSYPQLIMQDWEIIDAAKYLF